MSLRGRLLLAFAYVVLLALVAFGVPLALSLRDRVSSEVRFQAASQVDILASSAADMLAPNARANLDALVAEGARSVHGRVIVVGASGQVLADSAGRASEGESYAARPEIAAALAGRNYQATRHSDTLSADILATATPIRHNGRPAGAVRVTQSIASVNAAVRKTIGGLALIGAVVLLLGLAAGAVIAGQVARPLRRLGATVRRIADGDVTARAPLEGSSEQHSLARAFNEMTERLSGALDAQQRFVADASHQLRTPLTGLRLRIEEAQASGVSAAAEHELVEGLHEVDRLAELVEELLLLSRAGERPSAAAELVELAAVADRAVERWHSFAAQRGVDLTREWDRGPLCVSAYPDDVARALDCLVENAIHYSEPGGVVSVQVRDATVEVLDRGAGIAPDERERLFERFHRGHAGRKGPAGTGLGLAIARELARRWGGEADLGSRPGGGTRATLAYPAVMRSSNGRESCAPVAR